MPLLFRHYADPSVNSNGIDVAEKQHAEIGRLGRYMATAKPAHPAPLHTIFYLSDAAAPSFDGSVTMPTANRSKSSVMVGLTPVVMIAISFQGPS